MYVTTYVLGMLDKLRQKVQIYEDRLLDGENTGKFLKSLI